MHLQKSAAVWRPSAYRHASTSPFPHDYVPDFAARSVFAQAIASALSGVVLSPIVAQPAFITNSLREKSESSALTLASVFCSDACLAFATQNGTRDVTTAASACTCAMSAAPWEVFHPSSEKPTNMMATAPHPAPNSAGLVHSGYFM